MTHDFGRLPIAPPIVRLCASVATLGQRSLMALLTLSFLFLPRLAFSDPTTIAVLAPTTGPHSLIADQIYAGVQLAIRDINSTSGSDSQIQLQRIDTSLSPEQSSDNPYDWSTIRSQLSGADIDFIIGGYTRAESAALNTLATEWGVPTMLLAAMDSFDAGSTPNNLVLEMGLPDEEVNKTSLNKWAIDNQLNKIVVAFDFENDRSYEYGKTIAPKLYLTPTLRSPPFRFRDRIHFNTCISLRR